MRDTKTDRATAFLIEDVVLTLGNLRGALAWLGDDTGLTPDQRRAGIARIDRQIAMLEDRARARAPAERSEPAEPAEFRSRRSPMG